MPPRGSALFYSSVLLQFSHSLQLASGWYIVRNIYFMGSAELLTFLNYSQWSMLPVHKHTHKERDRRPHAHTLQYNRSPMSIGGKQLSTGPMCSSVCICSTIFHAPSVILCACLSKKNLFFFFFSFSILLSYCCFDDGFSWWYVGFMVVALNFIAKTKEDCEITENDERA